MNLGLRDVLGIGHMMAEYETIRDHGDLRLLRRYEHVRREDLLSLTAVTDDLHKLFAPSDALLRTVCNAEVRMAGMTPFIKRLSIEHVLD